MSTQAPSRRVFMVDVLRLIASLQMINGHTLDALLLPAWEVGPGFDRYAWFRGLVSVAFLLVAGMAYYLATIRRFEAHKSNVVAVRKRLRRGVDLILIGYFLKFPYNLFEGFDHVAVGQWHYFATCGVLQCIGVTLLTLETMTIVLRKPQHVVLGAGVLSVLLVSAAPFLDSLTVEGPWRIVLNYVTHRGGSPFPVAPWGAFMLGGVVLGAWVLPQGAATPLRSRLWRLGAVWAIAYVGYEAFHGVELPYVNSATTYSSKPEAVFDRLKGITLFLGALAVLTHPIRRLPRVLALLSGETLAVYVIHLVLLFHPPVGLVKRIGGDSLELGQALWVSLAMVAATTLLTLLWHEQKKRGWLRALRSRALAVVLGRGTGDARTAE